MAAGLDYSGLIAPPEASPALDYSGLVVPHEIAERPKPEGVVAPGVMAAGSRFVRGAAAGLIGGVGELEQGAADVYNKVAGGKPEENPVHQQGRRVQEYGESLLNQAERETFTGKAGNVVGGVAPYLGATAGAIAAAPLVGASAAVGSAVGLSAAAMMGGLQSYEGGRHRALEEGATAEQADSAAWKEAAVGAGAAALPVGAVLRPIVRAGPGVREAVKAVLKKGAQDGVVFTSVADAQQFLNNAVDRAYAPERPLTEGIYDPSKSVGENIAQQAPTAAAGFLLGGGHGALEAARHRAVPTPTPGETPPPIATTPTPEQQAATPPGFTPVIEGGAVQGYRDAKGGYHDADEVHAAQAAAQQPGPPDAHGVLANIAEGKPAQTPRPPTPEPPTTPLPPDNPGPITEAKGEPAPVTSMPVVDRGKVQLAGEQQQLQQSDRQLGEFLDNLEISKDASAAADTLNRVQAVDQQLQNSDLTPQDRNTLVRRRDELLADTNPETLQETAAPLEMQRQALQQRQRIADRLRDINAQLGDTEQATALSPLPKPEPVSQTPEPPIAPSEPITNGLQQAPVTRDAVAAAIADPTTRVSQLYTQLRDALNKLGLDQVGLRLEGKIAAVAEGKASAADGQYLDRLIQVALDNKLGEPGMQLILHHEAVHAMRDLGLFTDAEWRVLSKSPEVRARIAEIEDRYKKQEIAISPETLIEEAIADQMAAWSLKPPPSLLGRIYNKIVNLLHSIGNALRGNGFNSVGDIAEHFRSGEIGRRPETQPPSGESKLALKRPEEDEMPKIPGRDGLTNPLKIPNDAPDRLARKLKRGDQKRGGVGAPTQTRAVKLPDGVHIGPVNVHQWIARVEKILTPEEIDRARTWYEDALPAYEKYFGKDKAPAMLGAWLMANQNATPGFAQLSAVRALEQYTNATSGKPGSLKAGLPHDKLMQYWGAIQSGDLSKLGDITTGQKIYDFIDSALQKNTRTFYGDDARAGAPAVADIHSFRDTGTIDDPMLAWVRNKFGDKVANKLTSDGPTVGRKEAPYEWAADRMRAWTDELNAQKYLGLDDWSPHQVQAVGWMTMSKMLGRPGMTAERAITANIRNLSYELDPGAGAPFNKTFPEWAGLSDDAKARISDAVLPRIVDIAKEIAGATEFARVKGLGGWHEFTNPAFKSRLIASPEVAGDVADIVGYLAEQTKVFGYRWIATGRKVGVSIYGDTLHDSAIVGKLWDRIVEKHPDLAAGFSPSIDANGTHGIEILLDRGGDAVLKRVAREMVPTIDAFAEESALGDVHIRTFKAAEESRANDWTRDPEGEGYLSRLDSRYGPEIRQRLELHKREEIEPAIRAGIDAERDPDEPSGKLSLRRDEFPEEADRPLAAPIPLDRLRAGPDSQREILGRFGTLSPGDDTTERLKIYNLQHLVDDPTRVDQVLDRYGFRAKYFAYAPDEKAGVAVKLPRIAKDGYANGTVWIYDPRSADGSFKDATYTNAWRLTHEIGHALTEPLLSDKYGASHREGQLGQEHEVYRGKHPNGKMVKVRGLTLDEAQRAIEWEDLAFRAQRHLLEQAGEKISDADFAHEYNINLSDAIYRTLTGEFGNPGEYGFLPADKPATLRDALALLERSETELAQSQDREPTEGVDLSTWQPASDSDVARAIEHGAANPRAGNSSESERPLGGGPRDEKPSLLAERSDDVAALDSIERETGERISIKALDEARGPLWSLKAASKTGTVEQEDVMKRVLQFHADVPFGQKIREAWTELRKDGIAKFRYGMLDRLDAVAQMEKGQNAGKLLDAQVGAYKAMRMTTNLSSVMHVLLKKGMISYDKGEFKPVAGFEGGFEAIFKPLAESGKVRLWQAWAVANRANRLLREGREKLMEQSDIDALLPLGNQHPEFAQVLAKYQAFNQKILDMAQQTGLIDADLRAKLRSNDYVPFYRILDQDGKVGGPGVKGGVGGQSAGVMRLKGGEAMVNDLFNNMTRNMSRMVDASFKNLAAVRTIDMAVKAGAAVRRPPDFKPVHHSATELQDALDNMGIGSDVIPASMKDFAVKMFTMVQPKDGDVVSIKREGKTEYYTISDPMMLAAFGPAHVKQNGLVMFGGKFSNLLRRGVTVMPDFMTANFIRDTMSAWVVSGGKTNPLKAVSGFVSALRNSPEAQEIAAAGGGGKGYYNVLPHDVAHQLSDDMAHSTKSVLHKAFEIWEKVGQASEQANRIAVYKTLKKQGATNAEAAYQAVDLLDFSMRGDFAAMRSITTLVPFLNARAQGIYKLWRAAKENPVGFWMRGTAIMLPALALTLNNIGQPWYDELSPNDKELYTHFMIGGQHFRLPKPFEIGALFMTAPEILANSWYGTEYGQHTTQRAAAVLMDQFNFNPTPQAIKPAMDQLMNQQGIGGNPIESHHWQDLPPAQRFTPRTSTLAKMLGQATDTSPLRIDAAISGYFGSFGSMVGAITTGVDHAFSDKPAPTKRVEELPLIGRYVRNEPALSTQWAQSWYAIAADAQQVVKGVKQYQESGEPKAAAKLLQDNPGAKWIATHAQQVSKQLSTIAKAEQRIQNAPDPSKPGGMSSDEKRQKLDEMITRRNQIQRNAVEGARMGRKEGPPA